MFCPLKGIGSSPKFLRILQIAVTVNDFPAPLEVPKTIIGFFIACNFASSSIRNLY
jgi:hypothetical protein